MSLFGELPVEKICFSRNTHLGIFSQLHANNMDNFFEDLIFRRTHYFDIEISQQDAV